MTTDETKRIPRFGTRSTRTGDEAAEAIEAIEAEAEADKQDLGGPVIKKPHRAWWHRHLDSEERQRVMTELGIRKREHWGFRFTTMLTLSVIVAVMGLSADSAAVVIGAMLLAPLMQPVLAAAACIAMALFRKSLRWILITIAASVWGIFLSYVLAALFHNGDLPNEVTSRTAPDIRDLVVALGAGVAGAYATVRKDASASLPGVAVAVALVPPLGAVGVAMQADQSTLALGALLLYVTNLIAIVFAGTIVFIITGFVPPRRLANTAFRTAIVGAIVTAIVIAIAIPLYQASTTAVERSEDQLRATQIVEAWLEPVETNDESISFSDDRISVVVRSFEDPIDSQPLIDALQREFGSDTLVSTEWERIQRAETTTTLAPTTTLPSDEELLFAEVERIVDEWLATDSGGDIDVTTRRRDALTIEGDVIRLDASGVGAAPDLRRLTEQLDAELGQPFVVQLTWLERQSVSDEEPVETPEEIVLRRLDLFARAWAEPRGVTVTQVSFDGTVAIVEVAGEEAPDATDLVREVEEDILTEDERLVVLFVERLDITTTTTTTTTSTTTTTVATATTTTEP